MYQELVGTSKFARFDNIRSKPGTGIIESLENGILTPFPFIGGTHRLPFLVREERDIICDGDMTLPEFCGGSDIYYGNFRCQFQESAYVCFLMHWHITRL